MRVFQLSAVSARDDLIVCPVWGTFVAVWFVTCSLELTRARVEAWHGMRHMSFVLSCGLRPAYPLCKHSVTVVIDYSLTWRHHWRST